MINVIQHRKRDWIKRGYCHYGFLKWLELEAGSSRPEASDDDLSDACWQGASDFGQRPKYGSAASATTDKHGRE